MVSSGGLGLFVIVIMSFVGIVAVVFLYHWMKSYRLTIRDPMNKSRYIETYWVMEKKNKELGIMEWKSVFWQPKIKTQKPPSNAIDVGKKGRKYAEAYRLSEDEYLWITDQGINVKEKEVDGRKVFEVLDAVKDEDGKTKYKPIDTFKPFSVTQRDVLVSEYKKAQEISGKQWTPERIVQVASIGMMAMVIIIAIVFAGDLAHLVRTAADSSSTIQSENTKFLQQLKGIQDDLEVAQTGDQQGGDLIEGEGEEQPRDTG